MSKSGSDGQPARHETWTRRAFAACAVVLGLVAAPSLPAHADRDRVRLVVIDAGHGGDDLGAVGRKGTLEKDICLKLSKQLGAKLNEAGIRTVYTRTDDSFVSLADRTTIANTTRAHLYLSLHANSAEDPTAQGPETYFLSVTASDDEALQVAEAENEVFKAGAATPDNADIVGSILGEMITVDHMQNSSRAAGAIQHELGKLPGPSRGVKQGPLVVLSGVNMPAVLLEIGFLTNPTDEKNLTSSAYRDEVAAAITRAIEELRIVNTSSPESVRSRPRSNGAGGSAQGGQ